MEQTIFNNSNKSRAKLDFDELKSRIWWIHSSHNNSSVGGVYDGIVYCYYIDSLAFILPVCSI